ncbi:MULTISPECIES: alpha/beta fold hydrolase [Acidaminococcus]|uniref:Pimeloyl-ACP methyl ester carboxylesterase n=1 Tax=Acidaminococcus fermentans TaxID=905 RepID=A0A1H2YNZ1_ACIFE|nr:MULTISPECIES: alpha/beta hydrolase [Acidaminococcus]SDX06952.1 Pimeloyl-ACP methyl ester carboxylesterase [Acidaminococcus fermentans]
MPFITTNDNVSIYYEIHGEGKPLFMLPGWTCSTKFWKYNVDELARHFQVVLMDMRGHGESEKVLHSHRISRYAMDVKNLLDALDLKDVTVLGWSMGASILWSYIELFGNYRIDSLICVDQSPAQYVKSDWPWGQKACFDVETFMETCFAAKSDPRGAAEGLVSACLKHAPSAEDRNMLVDEICKCPPYVRIEIMRDHTNLDWRDFLPHINIPTLVCCARESKVFDVHGSAWVGEHIPGAQTVIFEDCSHMLFWEKPEQFNQCVTKFIEDLKK